MSSSGDTLSGGEAAARAGTSAGNAPRAAHIDELALLDMHFVSLVRGYEELYLREHPLYEDRLRKRAVWEEVATIVGQPAEDCRKRWKRMRANYFRTMQRTRRQASAPQSQPGRRPERPAHEKLMTFLDASFLSKQKLDNILATTVHHADQEASEPDTVSSSDTETSLPEDAAPSDEPQEELEDNEDVNFFVELGETIKDFPEAVRIYVKREAFRIVTDAEEMLYHRKLREDLEINKSEDID